MKKAWAAKKGFTIIELLVSIAVIAILAGITIVSYSSIQQRARDTERSGDIIQLKVAIEKYRAEKSMYPQACAAVDTGCPVSNLAPYLAPYLDTIPHDPRNAVDSADDYTYIRGTVAQDSYAIRIAYEAKTKCKDGTNINAAWWVVNPGDYPTC